MGTFSIHRCVLYQHRHVYRIDGTKNTHTVMYHGSTLPPFKGIRRGTQRHLDEQTVVNIESPESSLGIPNHVRSLVLG